jgi:hypothetical protein
LRSQKVFDFAGQGSLLNSCGTPNLGLVHRNPIYSLRWANIVMQANAAVFRAE